MAEAVPVGVEKIQTKHTDPSGRILGCVTEVIRTNRFLDATIVRYKY